MPINEDDILQVCEITGCDVQQAEQYLEIANGDVTMAVSLLLDDGPVQHREVPNEMDEEDLSADDSDTVENDMDRIRRVYDSQGAISRFSSE